MIHRASTSHSTAVVPSSKSLPVLQLSPGGAAPQWRGAPCRHGRTPPGLIIPPNCTPFAPNIGTAPSCTRARTHAPTHTHTLPSPPHCFLLEPLVYVVHTTMRVTTQTGCLVYFCRPAPASTPIFLTCTRLSPTQVDDACAAGCAVGWLARRLADRPVLSRLACFVPGLACSQDPSCSLPRLAQAIISLRSRNLGTELPYGSGMAYGRCDRVLDSIYPPAHTSPG